jgi:hypothetical protein
MTPRKCTITKLHMIVTVHETLSDVGISPPYDTVLYVCEHSSRF